MVSDDYLTLSLAISAFKGAPSASRRGRLTGDLEPIYRPGFPLVALRGYRSNPSRKR